MTVPALKAWHRIVNESDFSALDSLLADDVVFHSPVVHTPQAGKALVTLYLRAAGSVLLAGGFRYVREIVAEDASGGDAVLEFEAELDGIHINGVDLIRWDREQRIIDFKVMVRPLQAVNKIHQLMGEMLREMKSRP